MKIVCELSEVPVGGAFSNYDGVTKKPWGDRYTVVAKGPNWSDVQTPSGPVIREPHVAFRSQVAWFQ